MSKQTSKTVRKQTTPLFIGRLKDAAMAWPVVADAPPIINVAPQMHSANLFQFPPRWACCPQFSLSLRTCLRAARNHPPDYGGAPEFCVRGARGQQTPCRIANRFGKRVCDLSYSTSNNSAMPGGHRGHYRWPRLRRHNLEKLQTARGI